MNAQRTEFQVFSNQIISWYKENPRELPWRETTDPYKIWLSEVILQQTRVAQGLPYYYVFTQAFPSVKELALATESEILRLWQGLGYYSRARNLHGCAKHIWYDLGGKFPSTYDGLIQLRGIGSYTAAAISSFAFGEIKAVVDGNVFRVIARYFGIETDIGSSKAKKEFELLANQLIPKDRPAEFNQAIMDFGARLCTPKIPGCSTCPIQSSCFAFKNQLVRQLPVKIKKTMIKDRSLNYLVIRCGEFWVWKKRGEGDIWTGLHDFPLLEGDLPHFEASDIQKPKVFPKKYRHLLSHQRLFAGFSELEISVEKYTILAEWCENKGFLLVREKDIDYLAKPKLIVNFLDDRGI